MSKDIDYDNRYDERPDGSIRIIGTRSVLHPNGMVGAPCPFAWSARNGNLGRHVYYRCQYGLNHTKQHRGRSIGYGAPEDDGVYVQTFGTVPGYRITNRA